jgi:DNA-binding HxlR family transcriptional regulator
MRRKTFEAMSCPIARSLEMVGEWWSILILREAWLGKTHFDEFQKSLGIGSNTLTRRLNGLVAHNLLERRACGDRPARHEYVLTESGRDFQAVLEAFIAWGNRHASPRKHGREDVAAPHRGGRRNRSPLSP